MARATKTGRNDLCPCGSGKKSKKCCELKAQNTWSSKVMLGLVLAVLAGAVVVGFMSFTDTPTSGPAPGQVWSQEHGHYH
jgi:hypothetical protein